VSSLKQAARVLGIAESTPSGSTTTILAGVVMRNDLIIDGVSWVSAQIGGMDATKAVLELVDKIQRADCGLIMVHGSVIARYNMIDLPRLHESTGLPVISITREPQEDLLYHLKSTFPEDWKRRWSVAQQNGPMYELMLPTGITVFAQFQGQELAQVKGLVGLLTKFGGIPEPIRVARLFARALANP
jgi:endonuclease V-like protein UPF0215 family